MGYRPGDFGEFGSRAGLELVGKLGARTWCMIVNYWS